MDGALGAAVVFSLLLLIARSQSLNMEHETHNLNSDNLREFWDSQNRSSGGKATSIETTCSSLNLWYVKGKDGQCHCGNDYDGIVNCDSRTGALSVMDCYCLTQHATSDGSAVPVVGSCIFNCMNITTSFDKDSIFHGAPSDCGQLNRRGTLCGKCESGHAVPAYSYTMRCIRCKGGKKSWGLYVARALGPLTLFTGIILVFRIKVVSPKVQVFVLAAQIITTPITTRLFQSSISMQHQTGYQKVPVVLLANIYGIWNLDFLRFGISHDFCINVSSLQLIALDYVVAVYPMILMVLAYILVQLHYCGFKPVLYAWKPFYPLLARFRRQWGIKTSIIDTQATFFFLSTNKLFSVSFSLLVGTRMFTPHGTVYWSLFYDPSVALLGNTHRPFFLLAVAVLAVFVAFPTSLLLFFQCRWFQKCYRKLCLQGSTVDEFVGVFQQYYKDGRDGSRDMRWFSGFFVIFQIGGYLAYANSLGEICYVLQTMLFVIYAVLVLLIRPFKAEYDTFNVVYPVSCLWQALFFASCVRNSLSSFMDASLNDFNISTALLCLVPLVYITAIILHHFYKKCLLLGASAVGVAQATPLLPHRLLHSSMYQDSSFKP